MSGEILPSMVKTRPIGMPSLLETAMASVRSPEEISPLLTSKSPIIMFFSSSDIRVPLKTAPEVQNLNSEQDRRQQSL
jgi:hypothetical protein